MPPRIIADPALPPVRIPAPIWNEICSHALKTEPAECCGLVTGDARVRFQQVHRCTNVIDALHARDPLRHPCGSKLAFHMDEIEYLRVQREAEAAGRTVTAIYHSHVGVDAHFSELDQAYANETGFPFPEADHIVVSVVDGLVRGGGVFRREPRDAGFRGRRLEEARP